MNDRSGSTRPSRWGGSENRPRHHASFTGRHHSQRQDHRHAPYPNNPNLNQPPTSSSSSRNHLAPKQHSGSVGKEAAVSDEEALQALLNAATERERERSEPVRSDNRKGRHGQDHSSRNNHQGQRRNSQQQQQLPENDSYYGPRRNSNSNNNPNDRSNGPVRIEGNSDHENDTRKGSGSGVDATTAKRKEEESPPSLEHKPNFGLSGALARDTGGGGGRMYKGVLLKFQEPPEARAPNTQWRFYVFKGKEALETLHISKQSAYLIGRNQDICDIYMAHPSLSGQHAVLQYRALPQPSANNRISCQPYIMDLESTNGTFLNSVRIDSARYYQLKRGDVLTFGGSTREYVLMTENTTNIR